MCVCVCVCVCVLRPKILVTRGSDTWRIPSVEDISRGKNESIKRDTCLDQDRSQSRHESSSRRMPSAKNINRWGNRDLRLNPDRSQSRENATRDACHWLKATTNRRSSQQEGHRPIRGQTSAESGHRIAPGKRRKGENQNQPLTARAEKGKTSEGRKARFGRKSRNWPETASSAQD